MMYRNGLARLPLAFPVIWRARIVFVARRWRRGAGLGAAGELVDPNILRVCADPSNMPFTDESGEGFENKLAELVAQKPGGKSVAYTWFPSDHRVLSATR